jgi:hypothetical protein
VCPFSPNSFKSILLSIFLFLSTASFSQRGINSRPYWSTHILLSSSTFLSDLGGNDFHGSNDPSDIDFRQIRYAFGSGIQYNLPKGLSIGLDAFYTRLAADDAETNWNRKYRKLKVRTDIIETSIKLEYTVPQYRGALSGFYANAGTGLCFYRPMNELNGVWYKLRPLGTQGQFADPSQSPYDYYSLVIPFGFGKKFPLKNGMTLALDISLRKTFTDYLDDVSGVYYDAKLIEETNGELAAYFSNPSVVEPTDGIVLGEPGTIRGNSENNDNYFLFGFKLHIPLNGNMGNPNTHCSYNNGWIKSNGSIPKIHRRGKKKRIRLFK